MNTFTAKTLFTISVLIPLYFGIIYLINVYQLDFVLIGVFVEMTMIPVLFGQFIFLIFDIGFLRKKHKKYEKILVMVGLLFLATSTIFTIGSFFVRG